MDKDLSVRPVQQSDRDGVMALLEELYRHEGTIDDNNSELVPLDTDRKINASLAGEGRLFVAIMDNKPIGYAYVTKDKDHAIPEITDMMVLEEHRSFAVAYRIAKQCE